MRTDLSQDPVTRLQRNYLPALLAHLTGRNEGTLRAAYELGRGSIADGVSMLDLVHVHHAVFVDIASTMREMGELAEILDAAAAFLMEALAPFAMTQQTLVRPEAG